MAEAPRVAVGSAATAASRAATAEKVEERVGPTCSHLQGTFLAATDSSLFGCNPVARHWSERNQNYLQLPGLSMVPSLPV